MTFFFGQFSAWNSFARSDSIFAAQQKTFFSQFLLTNEFATRQVILPPRTMNNYNGHGCNRPTTSTVTTSTSTSSGQASGARNSRSENIPQKIFPDDTFRNVGLKLLNVAKKTKDPGPVDVHAIHFEMLQVYSGELRKMKEIYDRHKSAQNWRSRRVTIVIFAAFLHRLCGGVGEYFEFFLYFDWMPASFAT